LRPIRGTRVGEKGGKIVREPKNVSELAGRKRLEKTQGTSPTVASKVKKMNSRIPGIDRFSTPQDTERSSGRGPSGNKLLASGKGVLFGNRGIFPRIW